MKKTVIAITGADAINEALNKLNKAKTVLADLTQDYSFYDKPALKSVTTEDAATLNSLTWINEYERITNYTAIAFDLVLEAQKVLVNAIEEANHGEKRV